MELPQAAVNLQPHDDHLRASVSDLVSILQHTSHTQQHSTMRHHMQLLTLQPDPSPPSPSTPQQQPKLKPKKQSLTRWRSHRLLLTFSPSPIISAPLSPIWFPSCSTRVTPSSTQPCVIICNSSHCSSTPPRPLHQHPSSNQNSNQKNKALQDGDPAGCC
jgi:hypothetical protein